MSVLLFDIVFENTWRFYLIWNWITQVLIKLWTRIGFWPYLHQFVGGSCINLYASVMRNRNLLGWTIFSFLIDSIFANVRRCFWYRADKALLYVMLISSFHFFLQKIHSNKRPVQESWHKVRYELYKSLALS